MSENDKDYMRMIRWLLLWLSLLWVSPLIDHDYTTLVVVFALLKRPEICLVLEHPPRISEG